MNVVKLLTEASKKFPGKPAILFSERSISFSQLKDSVLRLANGLKKLAIEKNAKIAVYLPNSPEYILSYLAAYSIGRIIVPLDFSFTQEELKTLINHSEAKILIARERKEIDFKKLKQETKLERIIFLADAGEFESLRGLIDENSPAEPAVAISDSDYSTIFYTSGSTGHPKGVLLNYRHLDSPVKAIEHFIPLTSRDVILCSVPLSHSAGWVFFMVMLYFGMSLVLQERFQPFETLKIIEKHGVSFLCLVPSMYIAMLSLKELDKLNLNSLKYVVVFGAPSSPKLLKRFHRLCPDAYLLNGWGMTETSPPNAVLPLDSRKIESVGKVAPWLEIKIVDDEDKQVPAGEVGELAVRGWPVMEGYYQEPELTASVLRNGWFYTGDLARLDSEGLLYIAGRRKEMIKVSGERVHAPEIEEVILRHPGVKEAAVVGVPDELRGEVPKAFVVAKEGRSLAEDELRYFCRQYLAHFKIPHYFEFKDALPKTRSGKIDKAVLAK